jgi:hypothetical protein
MLTGLLLAAAVASVATVAPPTATVLANRTVFNQPCVWFTSTAPDRLAAAASAALERLGWTVASSVGPLEIHLDAAQLALLGWDWAR